MTVTIPVTRDEGTTMVSTTGSYGQAFALSPELASSTFMLSRFSTEMAPVPSRVDHHSHLPIGERNWRDHAAPESNRPMVMSAAENRCRYPTWRFNSKLQLHSKLPRPVNMPLSWFFDRKAASTVCNGEHVECLMHATICSVHKFRPHVFQTLLPAAPCRSSHSPA